MRQRRAMAWGGLALAAVGAWLAAARPGGAAPGSGPAVPNFTAAICNAHPPRLAHAYASGISVVAPGSIVAVTGAAISNEDHAELLFKLGLLEGHLVVGRDLIDAEQTQLALPHFGHPIRELYDDISGELTRRGVTGFDGELIALEALAAARPTDPATTAQYDKVIGIIGAVRATVPAGLLDNERFMLGVLGEVATISVEDYSESIEGNRIGKPVEYHDSRGYLAYADRELRRLEGRPAQHGDPDLTLARAKLTEMRAVTGPLLPPERPVLSVAAYKAIVTQFKQAAAAAHT